MMAMNENDGKKLEFRDFFHFDNIPCVLRPSEAVESHAYSTVTPTNPITTTYTRKWPWKVCTVQYPPPPRIRTTQNTHKNQTDLPQLLELDPIGPGYFSHQLNLLQYEAEQSELAKDTQQSTSITHTHSHSHSKNKGKKKKQKRTPSKLTPSEIEIDFQWDIDNEDLYSVLGIKKYEIIASVDDIRAAC